MVSRQTVQECGSVRGTGQDRQSEGGRLSGETAKVRGRQAGARSVDSGAVPAVPDRLHELLAAVGEDLAALTPRRDRNEADDGKGQREADHHAEDECKHISQPDPAQGLRPNRHTP